MSRSAARLHLNKRSATQPSVLNKAILCVAFLEPLFTVGQIWQIWEHKDATGNSLVTWVFFDISAVIWLLYALKLNIRPLIITELLWIFAQTIVIAEILYFSG
jgi:uncharacterized protein with PQ loop repeat